MIWMIILKIISSRRERSTAQNEHVSSVFCAGRKRMGDVPPHETVQGVTGHDQFGTSRGIRSMSNRSAYWPTANGCRGSCRGRTACNEEIAGFVIPENDRNPWVPGHCWNGTGLLPWKRARLTRLSKKKGGASATLLPKDIRTCWNHVAEV